MYVVAKNCKDQYFFNQEQEQNFIKKPVKQKRKTQRSVLSILDKNCFLKKTNRVIQINCSHVSIQPYPNLFKGDFPTEEMQSKFVNSLTVPVDDQFLGIFAILTNQVYTVSIKILLFSVILLSVDINKEYGLKIRN